MEYFLFTLRIVLAGVFFLAGIGKLLDLKGSQKALNEFSVPQGLVKTFAVLLPLAEISIAILLLFSNTSWFSALGGFLLLLVFIGGMLWQLKLGNAPDCHCFGQIHSEPVGKKSLLRNVLFAIIALFLVVAGRENQGLEISELTGNSLEVMQIIFGLIIIGFLFVLVLYSKKITDQQTQILRRLDVLEIVAGDGKLQERDGVGSPNEGLPIGSPLPNFIMPTADGRVIALEDILAKQKPILFFNVSPDCKPCEALLPEIEKWEKELSDKISFVFTSNGSLKENLKKFNSGDQRDILIQDDKELAELLEIKWTPTALFVNAKGIISSHPAAGDVGIRELIDEIRSKKLDDEFVFISKENSNGDKPKIGETIPEFALEDLKGKQITTKDLRGKKTLLTFWSMTCPHCVSMIEELSDWDKVKGLDEPNLIVFSDGEAEAHEPLQLNSSIILDKDYETAEKLGMFGTPSAVLVNEDGKIVSETAVGAGQIWALVGRKMK